MTILGLEKAEATRKKEEKKAEFKDKQDKAG